MHKNFHHQLIISNIQFKIKLFFNETKQDIKDPNI